MQACLTDARYRFTVSFVEYFLRTGLQSPHKLLNEFIMSHTMRCPGDNGDSFTQNERDVSIKVMLTSFEWDKLERGTPAL